MFEKFQTRSGIKTFQFWHCPLCGAVKSRLPAVLRGRSWGAEEPSSGTEWKGVWEAWDVLRKFYLDTNLATVKKRGGGISQSFFLLLLKQLLVFFSPFFWRGLLALTFFSLEFPPLCQCCLWKLKFELFLFSFLKPCKVWQLDACGVSEHNLFHI